MPNTRSRRRRLSYASDGRTFDFAYTRRHSSIGPSSSHNRTLFWASYPSDAHADNIRVASIGRQIGHIDFGEHKRKKVYERSFLTTKDVKGYRANLGIGRNKRIK